MFSVISRNRGFVGGPNHHSGRWLSVWDAGDILESLRRLDLSSMSDEIIEETQRLVHIKLPSHHGS